MGSIIPLKKEIDNSYLELKSLVGNKLDDVGRLKKIQLDLHSDFIKVVEDSRSTKLKKDQNLGKQLMFSPLEDQQMEDMGKTLIVYNIIINFKL